MGFIAPTENPTEALFIEVESRVEKAMAWEAAARVLALALDGAISKSKALAYFKKVENAVGQAPVGSEE